MASSKIEHLSELKNTFEKHKEKVLAILFSAKWFTEDASWSIEVKRESYTLDEIRKQMSEFEDLNSLHFAFVEVQIDSDDLSPLLRTWGVTSVPTIQFYNKPCFSETELPKNKIPTKEQHERSSPWDLNGNSYDLVGLREAVRKELRSFLYFATDKFDEDGGMSPTKKMRLATRGIPERLKSVKWGQLREDNVEALQAADGSADPNGIKSSALLGEGVLLYHHRAGSNPFLSENYPMTFWYTVEGCDEMRWKSAQQAYQAAKFQDTKVVRWIQEAETADEARRIANEYDREPYCRKDFRKHNLSIMFDIALAKFSQNLLLARWLIGTDEKEKKPPIFHTVDSDAFWGLGQLEGDSYKGRNWNGQILMCVREALKPEFRAKGSNVLYPLRTARTFRNAQHDVQGLHASFARLGLGNGKEVSLPLPEGTLIDGRYRVIDHLSTSGLGSYAGQFSYICNDEMLLAPSLDKRVAMLLGMKICSPLSDTILKLHNELCLASEMITATTLFNDAFEKINQVKKKLFGERTANEAWNKLHKELEDWKAELTELESFDRAGLDKIAFRIESLFFKRTDMSHSPSVFVKTFTLSDERLLPGIRNEIEVCSSKKPDFFHENICGISHASFGGPVETLRPDFGWIGLCAPLQFVALENCDGCDLWDFFSCWGYGIGAALQSRIEAMGFQFQSQDIQKSVNRLLQAALDFQSTVCESFNIAERALGVADRRQFLDKLSSFVDDMLSKKPGTDGNSLSASGSALATSSLTWTSFDGLIVPESSKLKHFRRFDKWEDLKACLNRAVDAADQPERLESIINRIKLRYPRGDSEDKIIAAAVRKLQLVDLKQVSALTQDDVKRFSFETTLSLFKYLIIYFLRWRLALHAIWPALRNLHASLTLRYILESIHVWDWRSAKAVLKKLKIRSFENLNDQMDESADPEPPTPLTEESIELLYNASTELHNAGVKFLRDVGKIISNDSLCLSENFTSWPDELVSLLLEHLLSSKTERLRWMVSTRDAFTCPASVVRVIFLQAAKAIQKLHQHQRVHADIKPENFNLTAAGQVKLLDFGFMVELSNVTYPEFFPLLGYSSPQLKLLDQLSKKVRNESKPFGDLNTQGWPFEDFRKNLKIQDEDGKAALTNIEKHCKAVGGFLNVSVINRIYMENDIWMLGTVLTKMAKATPPVDAAYPQIQSLILQIRRYEITEIDQLISNDWLQQPAEADQDELRAHIMPLFIRQPSLSGSSGTKDAEPLFEADIGYVNTGKGYWRVFRVGTGITTLRPHDEIEEIDGKRPPKLKDIISKTGSHVKHEAWGPGSERLGTYYSEMKLKVRIVPNPCQSPTPANGETKKTKPVSVWRTKLTSSKLPKGDPDRFRDYLFDKTLKLEDWEAACGNGEIEREKLRLLFLRWWGSHDGALLFDQVLHNWHCRGWIQSSPDQDRVVIDVPRITPSDAAGRRSSWRMSGAGQEPGQL